MKRYKSAGELGAFAAEEAAIDELGPGSGLEDRLCSEAEEEAEAGGEGVRIRVCLKRMTPAVRAEAEADSCRSTRSRSPSAVRSRRPCAAEVTAVRVEL